MPNSTPFYKYQSGLGNSASYQVSSKPYTARHVPGANDAAGPLDPGSPSSIKFDTVTRWIQVTSNSNRDVRMGFSEAGTATNNPAEAFNYIVIKPGTTTPRLELRVTEVFFMRDDINAVPPKAIDVVVGLTTIDANNLQNNWSGSLGVG